ncbi:hypothetical protein [Mucilaginibacter defluvii]|uniref:hypothetical protein n=1 Tax=Mucilaginibacter defluvii TaxID=1196019 RepID=UPI0031ED9E83
MRSNTFPENLSQNKILPIRVVSPEFGRLSPESAAQYSSAQRLPYYFFLFVLEGSSQEIIDGVTIAVSKNELLFALPHQIRQLASAGHDANYYKLGLTISAYPGCRKSSPFCLTP